jgi:hypothetical protein
MGIFTSVHWNWLWFVWAAIAVCVVFGYFRVRHQLHRAERSADAADEASRKRHAAEHHKKKHGRVE